MKTLGIILIALPVMYILGALIYASATRYNPIEVSHLDKKNPIPPFMISDSSFSIVTWNIGYGGLGKESDFFYDGGEMVRPTKELLSKNLNGILNVLKEQNADFLCLQEVDTCSKRSYRENQLEIISRGLPSYEYFFSKNYDVNFVPRPFFNPLGKITSGLATFSLLPGTYLERIGYESETHFPNYLFMLRRCFSKTHIPLSRGKDLVIINTHNSAYDSTGKMKKSELDKLIPYVYDLYEQGHYVIASGDWNQCPPDYNPKGQEEIYGESLFPKDFLQSGWKWASDNSTPTNRKLDQKYNEKSSYTTVIDFFLVSPNIKVNKVQTIPTQFEYSDHQPVRLEFTLN